MKRNTIKMCNYAKSQRCFILHYLGIVLRYDAAYAKVFINLSGLGLTGRLPVEPVDLLVVLHERGAEQVPVVATVVHPETEINPMTIAALPCQFITVHPISHFYQH